jgi:hypothetical protein
MEFGKLTLQQHMHAMLSSFLFYRNKERNFSLSVLLDCTLKFLHILLNFMYHQLGSVYPRYFDKVISPTSCLKSEFASFR